MKKIIVWGSAAHSKYTIDIIEQERKYSIFGIYDPTKSDPQAKIFNYKIYGNEHNFVDLVSKNSLDGAIVAIGDNWIRKKEFEHIKQLIPDFPIVNAIHPSVPIGKNVKIGEGVVAMAGVIINTDAFIGNGCFFATQASLEHDCIMDDFSSISAGVITGGLTRIGECTALTLGVITFDRITIGKHSVIGSGSLVTKDIPDFVLAYGTPAKVIRSRQVGEKYL